MSQQPGFEVLDAVGLRQGRSEQRPIDLGLKAPTLIALLRARAHSQPDDLSFKFLIDGEGKEADLTYAGLDRRARVIAAYLQARLSPGDPVLLLYPPGLEYISAFFGCLYAGMVAVPTSLPHPSMQHRALPRLISIITESGAQAALTQQAIYSIIDGIARGNEELHNIDFMSTDTLTDGLADEWREVDVEPDALALVQYTSGSISAPKGVALTHRNILFNQAMITAAGHTHEDQCFVGWLPPTHDMGLFGGILHMVYIGRSAVLMSPEKFLQRPVRWLEAISKHRGTVSAAPNFAFDLCVAKTTPEERERLDLSSWRLVFNGAEPIRPNSLEQFFEAFAVSGLRRSVMYPCYGLAESTLIVSGGDVVGPKIVHFDTDELTRNHAAVPAAPGDSARALVGCGRAILTEKIKIVDPETCELRSDGQVGEIWISSPAVAHGYWKNPELSKEIFQARIAGVDDEDEYLRTGDFGFLHEGELFVTGRLKDLIIIHGSNHYPQDIEHTAARHPLARRGGACVFEMDSDGVESVVIVQEVKPGTEEAYDEVIEHILRDVATEHQVPVSAVVLTAPRAVPKTTSGKVQRRLCKKLFLDDELQPLRMWRHELRRRRRRATTEAEVTEDVSVVCEVVVSTVRPLLYDYGITATASTDLSLLGLSSVRVAELFQSLQERLLRDDLDLEMNILYEHPRLDDLASFLFFRGLVDSEKFEQVTQAHVAAGHAMLDDEESSGIGENFSINHGIDGYDELPFMQRVEAFNRAVPKFFDEHYLRCIDSSMEREVKVVDRASGDAQYMVMFGSNNYLGLANHPYIRDRVIELINKYGIGVSGAPALNGYTTLHLDVEEHLARFKGCEAAMLFSSGYNANVGLTHSIAGARTLVVYDEFCHASFLDGLSMARARAIPFRHNSMTELERILGEQKDEHVDIFVAVEGLYSMDGDVAPMDQVVEISHRYGAMVVVDDAHGTGIYGPRGEGVAAHFSTHADITMGTFSKVLAVNGGFIAGDRDMVDFLRYNQRSYIFSTSIAPVLLAAVKAGLELLDAHPELNQRLWDNIHYLASELDKIGIHHEPSSPIFPILFPEGLDVAKACSLFRERNLFVNPIVYPAVPKSKERLRVSVKASHTREDLDRLVQCFHDAWEL
ncbi:aminotransferase class I/II-fold pyridoxal phosphate-dependent enzyme [Haliangium sp.]|uniref:aminotransferase class I/II-fold pyridoxal phosphate-dependent enzyme n=1 Tax=Haliangium sp. TaxID=2663208 RepID=UPI003D0C0E08